MACFEYDDNVDFNKILISKSEIENYLPLWKTKIYEVYQYKSKNLIEINILVAANSESEIQQWIHDYEDKSKCSYSIRSTEKCSGTKVKFKQRLKCVHNTRHNIVYDTTNHRRSKNSNCPSTITITLRTIRKKYKGKDKNKAPDPSMPCEIKILPHHNHSTSSADALRFRQVSNETREKLVNLFETGYSPANALESIKLDIRMRNDNVHELLADRRFCPDYMYCYKLYLTIFKKKYCPLEASPDFLEKKVDEFNKNNISKSAKIKFIDKDYVICLCPPLMQRVHESIEEASQIVFLDSTRTVDHGGQRIFVLSTASHCGDLPLAIFITTSDCDYSISVAFQLLKEIMGNKIFYGNTDGPTLFMTEDSAAEQAAIQSEWPKSTTLLCTFHVLQSVWRWLMKATNGIKQEDMNGLFQEFRRIMYASNKEECKAAFNIALTGAEKYPRYQLYLNNYWDQRSLWALCFHSRQGHNLSKAGTRFLKEKIFERIKAFSLIEVLDFVMTKFIFYYERRLLNAAYNRTTPNILHRLISPPPADIIKHKQHLTDSIDLVPSENESDMFYIVNTEVLTCSCNQGRRGNMCKHIDWIYYSKSDEFIESIEDERTKKTFFFIAMGNQPPRNWLEPSFSESSTSEKMENGSPINYTEEIEIIWEPPIDNLEEADEVLKGCETINDNKSTPNYTEEIKIIYEPFTDQLEEVDDEQYISEGTETISAYKPTTNNTENIEIIWEPSIDNLEKQYISKGSETINNMSEIFSEYLKRSPLEMSKALQVFLNELKSIKTVSRLATACHTFSSGIINRRRNRGFKIPVQPAAISRCRTNFSGRRSSAGWHPRKCSRITTFRRRQFFPKKGSKKF